MLLLLALVAAAPPSAELRPLPEGTSMAAVQRDRGDVARLRGEAARWAKMIEQGPRLLLFAETGEPDSEGPGQIVRVARVGAWPDDTVTSYLIVLDGEHRVRLFQESPVSFSGDWSLDLTHVFDEAGRTVAFARVSGFFNSECSDVARERSMEFFDTGGRRMARDYRLEDGKGNPLAPKGCWFPYRHEYRIHSDVHGALAAARLVAGARAGGAKLPR